MRILVIGRTGQLARSLAQSQTTSGGDHVLTFLGREALDLADPAAAEAAVVAARPDLLVNAAAYTGVDKAETEPDLAHLINAEGPGALARGAARVGAGMVHVSTDYVFDGARTGEWLPDDPTGPLGVYGATKLAGESAVLDANPRSAVLRTSWVYSPFGRNFVKTMIGLADRDRLTIVADQRGKPTSALDLGEAILAIAPQLRAPAGAPVWGLHHYAGAGETNWAEFAGEIFALAEGRLTPARPEIAPIATADYPTPAERPLNSSLDCSGFENTFGVSMVPWRKALARVVRQLAGNRDGSGT